MQSGTCCAVFCLWVSGFLCPPAAAQAAAKAEHPDDPRAWYWLGRNQLNRREFGSARSSAQRAIELDGNYAAAYRLLGEADRELNEYQDAYRAWLQANRLDPLDAQIPYYLGRLFYEANQFNEAAAWFREALRAAPKHFAAMTYLGLSAEALGMGTIADKLYRSAIQASKSQAQPFSLAFLSLAKLVRQGGEEAEALAILDEGERLCPEAHLLAALGNVLASANQARRAEAVLRRAIEMDPTLPEPHYRLSLLLGADGKPAEAKAEMEQFRKAKESEPVSNVLAIRK